MKMMSATSDSSCTTRLALASGRLAWCAQAASQAAIGAPASACTSAASTSTDAQHMMVTVAQTGRNLQLSWLSERWHNKLVTNARCAQLLRQPFVGRGWAEGCSHSGRAVQCNDGGLRGLSQYRLGWPPSSLILKLGHPGQLLRSCCMVAAMAGVVGACQSPRKPHHEQLVLAEMDLQLTP